MTMESVTFDSMRRCIYWPERFRFHLFVASIINSIKIDENRRKKLKQKNIWASGWQLERMQCPMKCVHDWVYRKYFIELSTRQRIVESGERNVLEFYGIIGSHAHKTHNGTLPAKYKLKLDRKRSISWMLWGLANVMRLESSNDY